MNTTLASVTTATNTWARASTAPSPTGCSLPSKGISATGACEQAHRGPPSWGVGTGTAGSDATPLARQVTAASAGRRRLARVKMVTITRT